MKRLDDLSNSMRNYITHGLYVAALGHFSRATYKYKLYIQLTLITTSDQFIMIPPDILIGK